MTYFWYGPLLQGSAQLLSGPSDVTLAAGQNTVSITAPIVPAVHITIPQLTNTISITAPEETIVPNAVLPAGQNTVTITAPTVPAVHLTIPQLTNTVSVTAPIGALLPGNVSLRPGLLNDSTGPTLIDNFNRADTGPPLSSNWTDTPTSLWAATHKVVGNVARQNQNGSDPQYGSAWWNAATFTDDMFAAVTATTLSSHARVGVLVRVRDPGTGNVDCYGAFFRRDTTQLDVFKIVNNVETLHAGIDNGLGGRVAQSGDSIGMRVFGNEFEVVTKPANSNWRVVAADVNSEIPRGTAAYAGIYTADWFNTSYTLEFDDFRVEAITPTAIVTITAPTATLVASGGATTLSATTNTITVTAPEETIVPVVTLPAGQTTVTVTNPIVVETIDIDVTPGWDRIRGNANEILYNNLSGRFEGVDVNSGTSVVGILTSGPSGDQRITATINDVGTPDYDSFGVVLRGASGPHLYLFRRINSTTVEMIRFNSGTPTVLQSFTRSTSSSTTHTIEFTAVTVGATVELEGRIDGTAVCQFTDSSGSRLTSGTPGVAYPPDYSGNYIMNIVASTVLAAGSNTVTTSAPIATLVSSGATLSAGQNTVTVTAPEETILTTVTLSAGQNTVTVTAPTVPGVHLTIPQAANTVTVTAPEETLVALVTLLAGQNTVTVTAPVVPAVHLTIPQLTNTVSVTAPEETLVSSITLSAGQNTVTVTAPEETLVASVTLSAGQNTVTITAPEETILTAVTLTAGQNTVTVTAPTAVLVVGGTVLSAGQNTVTVSAPVIPAVHLSIPQLTNTVSITAPNIPAVHLTIPQATNTVSVTAPVAAVSVGTVLLAGANTVTVTAPEETIVATVTLTAGQNTVTVTAPEETLVAAITLSAGQNTVTVAAPTVPAVHLTIPQTANTVNVTAPTATTIQDGVLFAGSNTVTVTAPEETLVAQVTLLAGVNTVAVTSPLATLTVAAILTVLTNTVEVTAPSLAAVHRSLNADSALVVVTAPQAGIALTFDSLCEVDTATVLVRAPIVTVQPQYGGTVALTSTAEFRVTALETVVRLGSKIRDSRLGLTKSATKKVRLE